MRVVWKTNYKEKHESTIKSLDPVSEIYFHLENGVEVYWGSLLYVIIKEKTEHNEYTEFSRNGEYALMIKCKSNGSKSLLDNVSIKECFIKS
jgi:hypothetical protein